MQRESSSAIKTKWVFRVILCYVMLFCVVLHYVMICYVTLCYVTLCYCLTCDPKKSALAGDQKVYKQTQRTQPQRDAMNNHVFNLLLNEVKLTSCQVEWAACSIF